MNLKIVVVFIVLIGSTLLAYGSYLIFEEYNKLNRIEDIENDFTNRYNSQPRHVFKDVINNSTSATSIPTTTPTPSSIPTSTPTPTPIPTTIEPSNNEAPEARLLTGTLSPTIHENFLSISVRANDDEEVEKVEFYANDELLGTVYPQPITGVKTDDGFDIDFQFEVTKRAGDYVEEQRRVQADYYIARWHRDWSNVPNDSCDIKKGYVNYIIGEDNYYVVRSTSDGNEHEICEDAREINVEDLWYYLFTNADDDKEYTIYAIAYDEYNRSTKTEEYTLEFD